MFRHSQDGVWLLNVQRSHIFEIRLFIHLTDLFPGFLCFVGCIDDLVVDISDSERNKEVLVEIVLKYSLYNINADIIPSMTDVRVIVNSGSAGIPVHGFRSRV